MQHPASPSRSDRLESDHSEKQSPMDPNAARRTPRTLCYCSAPTGCQIGCPGPRKFRVRTTGEEAGPEKEADGKCGLRHCQRLCSQHIRRGQGTIRISSGCPRDEICRSCRKTQNVRLSTSLGPPVEVEAEARFPVLVEDRVVRTAQRLAEQCL